MPGGGGGSSRQSGSSQTAQGSAYYRELADISREAWDEYKTFGRPQLQALTREVDTANIPGRIAEAQGLATADVGRSYDAAEGGLRRSLARYGLNPGSGRFMAGLRNLALGRAADTAGARTGARLGVLDRIRGTRLGILSAAQGQAGAGIRGLAGAASGLGGIGANKAAIGARKEGNFWSGIGQLGGLALSGAALFSDRRLKADIEPIGELPRGLNVYEFRFKGGTEKFAGLLADEVEKVFPEHVYPADNGYLLVEYGPVIEKLFDDIREAA